MPILKSSKKSVKVIEKKTNNNHEQKIKVRNYVRKCDYAIAAGNKEEAIALYKEVQINIDSAVLKGFIKKNTADRQKSRLNTKIKNM